MIKNIVFDFGGVLVRDTTKPLELYYHYNKLSPAQKLSYDRAFNLAETGKISFPELFERMHKLLAKNLDAGEVEKYLLNNAKVLPLWKVAGRLSKKYKVIIFSNNFLGWPEKMGKKLKINPHKFPYLNSSKLGMRKPNIKFYKYLLKKFNLQPAETIFIDDQTHNLVPAKKLGIKTFLYKDNAAKLLKILN